MPLMVSHRSALNVVQSNVSGKGIVAHTMNGTGVGSIVAQRHGQKYFKCAPPGSTGFPHLAMNVTKFFASSLLVMIAVVVGSCQSPS